MNGRFLLTGGMGGMGGAQPLAAKFAGAASITVEIDETRIDKRIHDGYCDVKVDNLDDALRVMNEAKNNNEAKSIGLIGNTAEVLPELLRRGIVPDIVTDQTSAHDPLNGYYPAGYSKDEADKLRAADPDKYLAEVYKSIATHVETMVEFQKKGAVVFDYGNNIRGIAQDNGGYKDAFAFKGFVPEYIRPLFCDGKGPFRWVALSGNPDDIAVTDAAIKNLFPDNEPLHRWIDNAAANIGYQALPSRICWLGTKFELAIITLGAAEYVLATPTGLPDWTKRVSSISIFLRVLVIASKLSQFRAAFPNPPYTINSSGLSAFSGSRLWCIIRYAASSCQFLQVNSVPLGTVTVLLIVIY
jgi:urocanate hydratase